MREDSLYIIRTNVTSVTDGRTSAFIMTPRTNGSQPCEWGQISFPTRLQAHFKVPADRIRVEYGLNLHCTRQQCLHIAYTTLMCRRMESDLNCRNFPLYVNYARIQRMRTP